MSDFTQAVASLPGRERKARHNCLRPRALSTAVRSGAAPSVAFSKLPTRVELAS